MQALKAALPHTEVLGVTVLTDMDEDDCQRTFNCSIEAAVLRFAQSSIDAGIDGLISSAKEVRMLRTKFGNRLTLNTPNIRSHDTVVKGDDQNPDRTRSPEEAMLEGVDRVVIGRQIIQAKNPYDAAMRVVEEIARVKP
jgi:orotidine-5'-phosphate decarboxylase